jgi:hypothetical protein
MIIGVILCIVSFIYIFLNLREILWCESFLTYLIPKFKYFKNW